ncbi:transcriptional regulatory protein C11D3.07c 1 [Colletotrichum truncatum]|uniref:Transcriptional regulatory protein C11D3.07c 1 n=1 Tax=Colletotrichum truncatum TaxID=5467 RepID=A0ACC3YJS6_COLTU
MMPLGVVLRMIWNPCAENAFLLKCLSTLMPSKRLADLFLDVYSDPSLDQYLFIIANFILYGMTKCEKSDITQDQAYHRKICAQNIESGLAALPLFLPRTHSVALALVLGCIYWMENSEPHLAWTSVVAASETSQSLGYHKQGLGSDIGSDEPNSSGLLFWLIYFNEKTLSLRLGRTSTIPEEDITIPPPGGNHQSGPIMFYCQIQIRVARAAGKIYSDLYSAYSLTMSPSYRRAKVKVLEREIQALQKASAFNQASYFTRTHTRECFGLCFKSR